MTAEEFLEQAEGDQVTFMAALDRRLEDVEDEVSDLRDETQQLRRFIRKLAAEGEISALEGGEVEK